MNDLQTHLFKTYFPYLVSFVLGVIVCLWFRGCGGGKVKTETVTIEKPVPVDTTKETPTAKGRFVSPIPVIKPKGVLKLSKEPLPILHTNTPYLENIALRVDTSAIIKAWLFERVHYDTTLDFSSGTVRLMWENYQNMTENLRVDYTPKKVPLNWALGVHGNVGMLSDFRSEYVPLFGLGLQVTVKKTYIAANYGFNGKHFVSVGVGYNFINR